MTDPLLLAKLRISLRRSHIRRKILEYLLAKYPEYAYVYEISRKINIKPDYIKEALEGGKHFSKDLSLTALNVVEKKKVGKILVYRVNPALIKALKEEVNDL